jgi:hypothetical protein
MRAPIMVVALIVGSRTVGPHPPRPDRHHSSADLCRAADPLCQSGGCLRLAIAGGGGSRFDPFFVAKERR